MANTRTFDPLAGTPLGSNLVAFLGHPKGQTQNLERPICGSVWLCRWSCPWQRLPTKLTKPCSGTKNY